MTTVSEHRIVLAQLSRAQLQQLAVDVADQLARREEEDRAALQEKLRSLVEEHGFDPKAVRLTGNGKRAARRAHANGKDDRDE